MAATLFYIALSAAGLTLAGILADVLALRGGVHPWEFC